MSVPASTHPSSLVDDGENENHSEHHNYCLPKPEKHLVVQIARNNIIGQCLNEALHELQMMDKEESKIKTGKQHHHEDSSSRTSDNDDKSEKKDDESQASPNNEDDDNDDDDGRKEDHPSTQPLTAEMSEQILHSFGEAVSNTQWEKQPSVLARGTLKRYTHYNTNWQIVVDDMKLRPRTLMGEHYPKRRRLCDRPTLWDTTTKTKTKTIVSSTTKETDESDIVEIDGPTQVLAYDDT